MLFLLLSTLVLAADGDRSEAPPEVAAASPEVLDVSLELADRYRSGSRRTWAGVAMAPLGVGMVPAYFFSIGGDCPSSDRCGYSRPVALTGFLVGTSGLAFLELSPLVASTGSVRTTRALLDLGAPVNPTAGRLSVALFGASLAMYGSSLLFVPIRGYRAEFFFISAGLVAHCASYGAALTQGILNVRAWRDWERTYKSRHRRPLKRPIKPGAVPGPALPPASYPRLSPVSSRLYLDIAMVAGPGWTGLWISGSF